MIRTYLKRFVIALVVLFGAVETQAQDIHFSQFYASPITLNPAMTGMMNGCYRAAVNYRNQWASVPAPYSTIAASFDMPILSGVLKRDRMGVGVMLFNDRAGYGQLNNMTLMASVAYHKSFDKARRHTLSLGFQGGFVHKSLNFTDLLFASQIVGLEFDPTAPNLEAINDNVINYFDMRAGGMWTSVINKYVAFYVGGSYYHITKPVETFLDDQTNVIDPRIVVHAGGTITPIDKISIAPSFIYMTQAGTREIVFGSSLGYNFSDNRRGFNSGPTTAVYIGASYRWQDALILLAGVEYQSFKFGISYDINISGLQPASLNQGGFELSLVYEYMCDPKSKRTYPPIHCPKF